MIVTKDELYIYIFPECTANTKQHTQRTIFLFTFTSSHYLLYVCTKYENLFRLYSCCCSQQVSNIWVFACLMHARNTTLPSVIIISAGVAYSTPNTFYIWFLHIAVTNFNAMWCSLASKTTINLRSNTIQVASHILGVVVERRQMWKHQM